MTFDKSKFIEQFRAETREHVEKLNLGLLKLEKAVQDKALLEAMMREAHTIKGSATMMGYKRIADIAHKMEDGLEKAIHKKIKLKKIHFDVLFKCLDAIEPLLDDKVVWRDKGVERPFVDHVCKDAEKVFSGEEPKKQKARKKGKQDPVPTETAPQAGDIPGISDGSIRVDIGKLDNLMNLSGELLISKIRLNEVARDLVNKSEALKDKDEALGVLIKDLSSVGENIDSLTSNMQDEVMNVRLIPVACLFNTFPRAMRDLAHEKGKEIELEIKGEGTQLDKGIIDEMADPIMHLLRNAVDHGIESLDERKAQDKPAKGKIVLSAHQQGSQVIVEVSDDGRGIDINKVKEQAVEKGIISKDRIDEMVDEQVRQLLFTPGFSTKEEVSEISGRGVGLDVVREAIARLKGMVEVTSDPGKGATFVMKLPLTLAITESLLVASGRDVFAIPIDIVVETIRVDPQDIKTVETKEAITVRGHILPLVRLNDIFGLPQKGIFEKRFFPVIVVQSVEKRIGISCDQLLGRQEIISKNLGEPLKRVKNIAGATILGDGRVILILDIPSVIESAEGVIIKRPQAATKPAAKLKKKKTILLAEDVMSTAMLEKNILESVGYSVVIAGDGKEALERASQERFDLIITDVLMPRMDGFEFTARLKADKLYKDIPIIIVTTRGSDVDKRKGLEAGADAYILKSDFTSEGLLETIERLVG